MRRLPSMALLLLLALAACNGSSNPTQPPAPAPLPMGIAKATALENLALIRTLQNNRRPGTLLVSLGAGCVDLAGRLCAQEAWTYSFSDRSGPSDIRYNWEVWDTGSIQSFDPVPATGPTSGIDIGPFFSTDNAQAVRAGFEVAGAHYLQLYPDGYVAIVYRHFASHVRAQVRFQTLSTLCKVEVDVSAATGEVLFVDDGVVSRPGSRAASIAGTTTSTNAG